MRNDSDNVLIWDPYLRAFHGLLVLGFAVAYLSEDDWLRIHAYSGYLIGALLVWRIIWGYWGPRSARFSDFVRPWATVRDYLQQLQHKHAPRYLGHNPAGGWMIVALLTVLTLAVITGLIVYGAKADAGPLATWLSGTPKPTAKLLKRIHELFANIGLALVFIHIAGVIIESRLHGENLARAMLHGRKQRRAGDADGTIR